MILQSTNQPASRPRADRQYASDDGWFSASVRNAGGAAARNMSRIADRERVLKRLPIIALLVALAFYLYNSATYYLGAGRDDTFITLWTGVSLAEGYGLVNYNLEPIEMSSSLLHTLLIGGIYIVTPDHLYTINKALGLVSGAIVLIVLHRKRHDLFKEDFSGTAALVITYLGLANSRSWLYWNLGGLETPYQSLILFLYGLHLVDFWKTPGSIRPLVALQILYLFVRPEGFILILFTTFFIVARARFSRPFRRSHAIMLVGLPGVALLAIMIARLAQFGLLFPNPVYAKVHLGIDGTTMSTLGDGLRYLRGFYTSSPYLLAQLGILTALLLRLGRILIKGGRKPDSELAAPELVLVLWPALILLNHLFVVRTGGDWMEFYRFMAPIVPFSVILTTLFSYRAIRGVLSDRGLLQPSVNAVTNLGLGVLLLILIAANSGQLDNYGTQDFHNCSEYADLPKLRSIVLDFGKLDETLILMNCAGKRDWHGLMPFITHELPKVYQALDQRLTIATFQMGFFPYQVRMLHPEMKVEFIDTLGIADAKIAQMRLRKARYGVIEGTDIVGILSGTSGTLSQYVLNQDPNMIYVLRATRQRREAMAELGWTVIWDRPGAVIFIRDTLDAEN